MDVEVFILGAGPAGCCAALNLAPFYRTLLIDRCSTPKPRTGESLPPAANKLLRDMGLLDEFKRRGHLPYYGNQSRWGSETLREIDFLRDPLGHGWHLDRGAFEIWLRKKTVERGAALLAPAHLANLEREDHKRWKITVIQADQRRLEIQARLLIDAGGRTPVLARRLGAARIPYDNLVCGWVMGHAAPTTQGGQGFSYIHAAPHGWWYTAPVPWGKRILAFHTRAKHPATARMHSARALMEQAQTIPLLSDRMGSEFFDQDPGNLLHGFTAAHSAVTRPAVGDAWLCVGDAALSFDPLSSQGLFNALYTGLAASESADRFLQDDISDFAEYQGQLEAIWEAYESYLQLWYRMETRWREEEFWKGWFDSQG